MTRYTEDDLRVMFAENSVREDGLPPQVGEIRQRGSRTRLRRRVTAGAATALAGAAAVVTLAGLPWAGNPGEPATGSPATSARFTPGVELPQTVRSMHGPLSLIYGQTYRAMGERTRITFRPSSVHTGFAFRCADPKAWLLVRDVQGTWNELTPCSRLGQGLQVQHGEDSVTPDWLRAPQELEVWVFPAGAPIGSAGMDGECSLADRRAEKCDGLWDREAIIAMPDRLAAETGPGRGLWSIGIYDKVPPPTP